MKRVQLQPAFVLHHRPYRNTSVLLDVFCRDFGRIGLVAKGVRSQRSQLKSVLQPFNPLLISYSGRGDLMTLQDAELDGAHSLLVGKSTFSGLYINELLLRLLHRNDPHEYLFDVYKFTIAQLADQACDPEPILRNFELQLLKETGYGLNLEYEGNSGTEVDPERYYRYDVEVGPIAVNAAQLSKAVVVKGSSLIALAEESFADADSLKDMKKLMRYVIAYYLGDKPLKSRELFYQGIN